MKKLLSSLIPSEFGYFIAGMWALVGIIVLGLVIPMLSMQLITIISIVVIGSTLLGRVIELFVERRGDGS